MNAPLKPLLKRPFLRAALFCAHIDVATEGGHVTNLIGIMDTQDVRIEGATTLGPYGTHGIPTYIAIDPVGAAGKHEVRLRWLDEEGKYVPEEGRFPFDAKGDEDGWTIKTVAQLRLAPPRNGTFRLLIELDGALIGYMPLKVFTTTTTRGES